MKRFSVFASLAARAVAYLLLVRPLMRIKDFSLYLLIAAVIQSLCYADASKLPAEDRTALQDAASIASLLITTEALVADKPKKSEGAPAAPMDF